MTMTKPEFQQALGVIPDGIIGPQSVAAFEAALTNKKAPALILADYAAAAAKLSTDVPHVVMVKRTESGAYGSFDSSGRPTLLYERHKFSFYSGRKWDARFPEISNRKRGGYSKKGMDHATWQWEKLRAAIRLDPAAAIMSCSWGLFQVMGFNWQALGYRSPLDFAKQMAVSEAAQLDAFVRFLLVNRLDDELRECRPNDPDSCKPLAKGYNGPDYEANDYDGKMASELAAAYHQYGKGK